MLFLCYSFRSKGQRSHFRVHFNISWPGEKHCYVFLFLFCVTSAVLLQHLSFDLWLHSVFILHSSKDTGHRWKQHPHIKWYHTCISFFFSLLLVFQENLRQPRAKSQRGCSAFHIGTQRSGRTSSRTEGRRGAGSRNQSALDPDPNFTHRTSKVKTKKGESLLGNYLNADSHTNNGQHALTENSS